MQAQRIILFTIGSVQEFINNSRKAMDLQNASNVLSKLMTTIIGIVRDDYNGKVILPVLGSKNVTDEGSFLCPNYFIAKYEYDKPIGEKLKSIAIEHYSERILGVIKRMNVDAELISQIELQLQTALDIYWCDVPLNYDEQKSIRLLYRHLEAVKNTRNYQPLNEPEGEKCHLCGIRNGIICRKNEKGKYPFKIQYKYTYKGDPSVTGTSIFPLFEKLKNADQTKVIKYKDFDVKEFIIDFDEVKLSSLVNLKKGECLCGVCLAKRMIDNNMQNSRISSLSGFAIYDWLAKVDPEAKNHSKIAKIISANEADYPGLYKLMNESNESPDKYQVVYKLWEEAKSDENMTQYKNQTSPPTFYCLYRMDIDNLGEKMQKVASTTDLSGNVYEFLESLIENTRELESVKIIYAGGDDLLALMPITKCYRFIKILNKLFRKKIKNQGYDDLTYSQGLFFAHHKTSFADVLRLSRDKLNEIKHRYSKLIPPKDGTVISMLTDGFSEQSVFLKNHGDLNLRHFTKLMVYFMRYSSYFHDTLAESFLEIGKVEEFNRYMFLQMFFNEQKRLMKRSIHNSRGHSGDKGKLSNRDNITEDSITEHKTKIAEKRKETENMLREFMFDSCLSEDKIDIDNYFNLFAIVKKLNSQIRGDQNEG